MFEKSQELARLKSEEQVFSIKVITLMKALVLVKA
jgi:hypothetical protein